MKAWQTPKTIYIPYQHQQPNRYSDVRISVCPFVPMSVRLFKNLHPQDYDSYSCQVWYSYVFLLHVDRVSFRFSPRPLTPSLIDKTVLKA